MSRSKSTRHPRKNLRKTRPLYCETLEDRSLPSCAAISGFVYYDANNNGLFDSDETPIANSPIELRNANNVVVGSTATDSNGFYNFDTDQSRPAHDETLTRVVNFPKTQTNFQLSGLLDQFDPSLGELQSITITHAGSITSEIKVENVSSEAESDITGTISGTLTLQAPGVNDTLNPSAYAGSFHADEYDQLTDFSGQSGTSFGEQTANASHTITLSGAALNAYIGTGRINITESAVATSNATGGGNFDAQIRSKGSSTVTVVYHYRTNECLAPGEYKITQTRQPDGYFDGRESKQGTVIPNTKGTDFINVTLGDTDLEDNNFGELKTIRLSGHVWHDADNDGVREASEAPIPGTTISLDSLFGPVVTTTDASGYYEFTDLQAGTYTVVENQPLGYLDGWDKAGTTGGTVVNNAAADQIRTITLVPGDNSQNNDFGEIRPASIAGHVYYDANNNGIFEAGESPIPGTTVSLTGFDDLGPVNQQMATNSRGEYKFDNLRPGDYALIETQPANYMDGKDTIGTPGGATSNDVFSAIELHAGVHGINNDFGEIKSDSPGEPLPKNVLPMGMLPIISKVQLTAVPEPTAISAVLRGQLAFVVGTMTTLTGQQPNATHALAVVSQLDQGLSRQAWVAQLWASDAHRALQAETLFQDVFGRAPTAQERAHLMLSLRTSGNQLSALEQLFVSPEYQLLHPNSQALASGLYRDILNIIPGTLSMQGLLQSMGNNTLNDVVHDLLISDASLANQIDDVYRLTVRRAATSAEISSWKDAIKFGSITLDQLAQQLLSSEEFYQLALANVQ